MLFGTRVLHMVGGLFATLADWPLLPRQQTGRPQRTVSPSVTRGRRRASW